MKNLRKKLLVGLIIGIMTMLFTGCSNNKQEEVNMTNFKLTIKSKQEFDYIKYRVGDFEGKMEPMHDDTIVKAGYVSNVDLDQVEMDMDVEVVQDGKVIFNKENIKIDLTGGKKAKVNLVDRDNGIDVEVNY